MGDMLLEGLSEAEIATLNRIMDRLLDKAQHIGAPQR